MLKSKGGVRNFLLEKTSMELMQHVLSGSSDWDKRAGSNEQKALAKFMDEAVTALDTKFKVLAEERNKLKTLIAVHSRGKGR